MTLILVICPNGTCGARYRFNNGYSGKRVKCGRCGTEFVVSSGD